MRRNENVTVSDLISRHLRSICRCFLSRIAGSSTYVDNVLIRVLVCHTLIVPLLMGLMSAPRANAEDCSIIGCAGEVGYVYLPGAIFNGNPVVYHLGGRVCPAVQDISPFGTTSLPAVNSISSISGNPRGLYTEPEIEQSIEAFRAGIPLPDKGDHACKAGWSEPRNVGMIIRAGVGVRILGYRTFTQRRTVTGTVRTGVLAEQLLFALVVVVDSRMPQ